MLKETRHHWNLTSSSKLLFWGVFSSSNHNCWNFTNIFFCYVHFFKPSIQHESKHIVSFRLKLEAIKIIIDYFKTMVICLHMLALSCFTLMHMSLLIATSTFACNFHPFLESCTYNLFVEATFGNSQYSQHCQWLTTHVITKGERASQITLVIAQFCAKGIMLAKATISWQ